MTVHPFTDPTGEPLADGGTWLLDLIAAVDHLRRGFRPDLTVWDALAEALVWELDERADRAAGTASGRDPLCAALAILVEPSATPTAVRLQTAIRKWTSAMADRYNNGHHWPHPACRRGFPPPMIQVESVT